MKIRTGFVSNSSSSSFIFVGVKFDDPNVLFDLLDIVLDEDECLSEQLDCDKMKQIGLDFNVNDENHVIVIGVRLNQGDDYGLTDVGNAKEFIEELVAADKLAVKALKKLGCTDKPKVLYGVLDS